MSRKTSARADKEIIRTEHTNFLRDEARASSWLLAYGDTTTSTLSILINAGVAYFGGDKVEFDGGYSPLMTAPVASSRIDVVSISSTPTIVVTVGVEADVPTAPSVPDSQYPICEVYHRAGEVEITDEDEGAGEGYISKDLRKNAQLGGDMILVQSGIITGDFSISGLNGDTYQLYKLIMRFSDAGANDVSLRFNADAGNNYHYNLHTAGQSNGALEHTSSLAASQTAIALKSVSAQTRTEYAIEILVYAKSGRVRVVSARAVGYKDSNDLDSTDVCGIWINTADNLISMDFDFTNPGPDSGEYYLYRMRPAK